MKNNNRFVNISIVFIALFFLVYVLYIWASIVIPFVVAMLLSFIIISLSSFFHYYWVPKPISFIASLITIGLFFFIVGKIIDTNIEGIIIGAPLYQERLISIFDVYAQKYAIDSTLIRQQILQNLDIGQLISWAATALTIIVKNAGLIIFFTLFILLESTSFRLKLSLITWWDKSTFFSAFEQIQDDMKSYFKIKTITSFSVSFLSAIIMFFFGLDFLVFWAFIIFLLNYIPNIGSIIAVSFPVLFSLIQFESLYFTWVFLMLMIGAQVLIGNIIEPRLMWNKLNLSPLVILVSLIFWGTLWWPVWMLLSVPIMVMVNIVLAHIEVTRPIAVLLSEKGMIKFTPPKKSKRSHLSLKKVRKLLQK